ncbi:MAG: NUDIX domain-containing protein [Ardenticatenaceae bacterium]|nr:NUDIX domain-containing protein [Anaerolineales bacterium]MCB8921740.1 NUDIX domain-containing protein [Ardenticatenaceae bacterium]MCB8990741.1 NUDIX domain-containing protein [Ardenticatenaceae bacterium]
MAKIGRFMGGVGALIWYPPDDAYLLLRRAASKDYAGGVWECVTGRVDQGEGFIEALHREVREEIGIDVQIAYFLGTTHFYRGTAVPQNELIGVVFVCVADEPGKIRLSAEHDAYQWVTADTVQTILSATDPSTQWALRVIARAAALRQHVTPDLLAYQEKLDFELG